MSLSSSFLNVFRKWLEGEYVRLFLSFIQTAGRVYASVDHFSLKSQSFKIFCNPSSADCGMLLQSTLVSYHAVSARVNSD